jgi:hypothetical protein
MVHLSFEQFKAQLSFSGHFCLVSRKLWSAEEAGSEMQDVQQMWQAPLQQISQNIPRMVTFLAASDEVEAPFT